MENDLNGVDVNAPYPRQDSSATVTGIDMPEHRASHVRFDPTGTYLTPAWAPESAGFLGLGARGVAFSAANPTMAGGLTPGGYAVAARARGKDPSFGGWVKNWWEGWEPRNWSAPTGGSAGSSIFNFPYDEGFMAGFGPDKYLEYIYGEDITSEDSRFNLYSKEMQENILNSYSKEQIHFKMRMYGDQIEATDRLENYDKDAGMLPYVLGKTISGVVNYFGQDVVGNIATLGASGALLKGTKALPAAGRTLGLMGGEATVGVAYGTAYEMQRVQVERQFGNEDAEVDGSTIIWGGGLGLLAGTAGAYFARNINNDILAGALIDEMSGQPASRLRWWEDMTGADTLRETMARSERVTGRITRVTEETGVRRNQLNWMFNENALKHSPWRSPKHALEWVETAKPSAAELDRLDHYFASKIADEFQDGPRVFDFDAGRPVPLRGTFDDAASPAPARAADDVLDDVDELEEFLDSPQVFDPDEGVSTVRRMFDDGLDDADEFQDGPSFFDVDSGAAAPVRSSFTQAASRSSDDLVEDFSDDVFEEVIGEVDTDLDALLQTEFQRTGKMPEAPAPKPVVSPKPASDASPQGSFDDALDRLDDGMELATSVGIMQSISRKLGLSYFSKLVGDFGTWGARGAGYRKSVKSVAHLYQHISPNGMRNADQQVARSATLSMDGARRSVEKMMGVDIGIQKVLIKNAKEVRKAIKRGDDIVSEVVAGGDRLGPWGKQLAQKFDEAFEKMGKRAERAGLIDKADDYFPVMFNKGVVQAKGEEFINAFEAYLTKHFEKTGDLSLITAKRLGWVDGPAGNLRVTAAGKEVGLTSDMTLKGISGDALEAYKAELPKSLNAQARRAEQAFHGNNFESLLTNPDALEEGAMYVKGFFATNSKKRQTLNKDIYLDEGMKPFMEQNIDVIYSHSIRNLGAETEFALSQLAVNGEALTFEAMVARTRAYIGRQKDISGKERAEMTKMIDQAERAHSASMGRLDQPTSSYGAKAVLGVIEGVQNMARTTFGPFWGIPVASMEVPRMLLANPTMAHRQIGTFFKAMVSSKYRWESMSAFGDALEATTLQMRGMLEMTGHEGVYMGRTATERFKAPWINLGRNAKANFQNREFGTLAGRGLLDLSENAATVFTQVGLMPLLTSAGRVATGRLSESILLKSIRGRKGNRLRSLADEIRKYGNAKMTPKQFQGLARKVGLNKQDAALYNRAGLLAPDVLGFMDEAIKAGKLKGRNIDSQDLYRWAQSNGMEDAYQRFSGAMTELVTERMNYMYATPNALSRADVNPNSPFDLMASMFQNFPLAFYQQNLQMVAQDSTVRGTALFTTYVALEALHKSIRDVVAYDPLRSISGREQKDSFLNPNAVLEEWSESPGKKFSETLIRGIPINGLYPLGKFYDVLSGEQQGLGLNIVEGQLQRLLSTAHSAVKADQPNGVQISSEYAQLFHIRKATGQ